MSQREDFEEAAARLGYNLAIRDVDSEDGEYLLHPTQRAWDMWQEAHDLYTQPQSAPPEFDAGIPVSEAQPVAWLWVKNGLRSPVPKDFADELIKDGEDVQYLYTQPQSAAPLGWKLVPIEPTNWMRTQGEEDIDDCSVKETWRRMLDAAPQPQSAE